MQVMMTIYEKVERIFGYRQLTLHMRRQTGKTINHKRIKRLMKVMGIQSVIREGRGKSMPTPLHNRSRRTS
uniref:transposase n=1 Tax=Paenibacillus sp. FSL H8-0537 TaxID=2921399 RepID=UPI0040539E0C